MMDFHILIVISCVFLASLFSLLFINKFFRRKTFEEIIAEKKALTDKIYGQSKAAAKKPKKLQQLKKEAKREKKQRQKEQQRDNAEEHEDSDAPSEQPSVDDEQPAGLSKQHVEFEPEPEVLAAPAENARRVSNAEKENSSAGSNSNSKQQKTKKDKKGGKSGILINKNEPVAVKENLVVEEQLNHFETKQPKDMVELKKQEKKDDQKPGKKEKGVAKKDKHATIVVAAAAEKSVVAEKEPIVEVVAPKEVKQPEEKVRQSSPKNQQQNSNSNTKTNNKSNKKQIKETAVTKELILALDKLNETDTVGVSLLMNLFRRAELNRSEIQILIDYLLNKQQDMPSSHSEWSDDICQKLKRQLEEKERALAEEQEASIGIQAKLRELRVEVNSERAQMNATIKAYIEKLQSKDSEVTGLNQELQSLNEKIALERQQFQAKLVREKQAGSQDLLAQLQLMQKELAHKDNCMSEMTLIVNASRQAVEETAQQTNDLIQKQSQQICALEQQRDELEQISNNNIFELEKTKTLETENEECKVEIRNLQNAFESYKVDMTQARNELESVRAELAHTRTVELTERQNEIQSLRAQNAELSQQLAGNLSKSADLSKEQSGLQVTLDTLKSQLADKERQLAEFNTNNSQLLQQLATAETNTQQQVAQQQVLHGLVDALKADVASKHQQLQEVAQNAEQFSGREKELLQQLHEQKEKNNDLRMKNWKLVEALQNAETTVKQNKALSSAANASLVQQQQMLAATQKSSASAADPTKDPKQIRELFQRLYPDAVKAAAGTALSASFEQWMEQVLATHVKQSISKANAANASSNKSTQSNNSSSSSSSYPPSHNSHNNNTTDNKLLSSESTNNSNSRTNSSSIGGNSPAAASADLAEMQKVHTQNAQLRTKIDELTKLVTKTSNTLSELEGRAREQDEHWRSIVRSKDDQIYSLQHSNGEQNI